MKIKQIICAGMLTGLMIITGTVGAAATAATIDFEGLLDGAVYGKSNIDDATYGCVGLFSCYVEKGVVFGTPYDLSSPFSHVHLDTKLSNGLAYHGDSAGIYVRAANLGAFSLDSLEIRDIAGDFGPNFNIVGFGTPYNGNIVGDTPSFSNQVAFDTINANGLKVLDASFSNINAFWIYYDGYTATPSDGSSWDIVIDNVQVSQVSAVPLPAAFWLMGSALLGLTAFGKKRAA